MTALKVTDPRQWKAGTDPRMPGATGWVTSVTIDCADPRALAGFWGRLLGLEVCPRRSRYVALRRPPNGTRELVFQPVPESKRDPEGNEFFLILRADGEP